MPDPVFPYVTVDLSNVSGNAFSIIGAVSKAIRNAGATPEQIAQFRQDATSGDYDHALQTCMKWVDIDA